MSARDEVRGAADSDPVYLANEWHDTHYEELDHDYSSCWCCCITCEHTNPHYDSARASMARAES